MLLLLDNCEHMIDAAASRQCHGNGFERGGPAG
jgi:hypothetical protein